MAIFKRRFKSWGEVLAIFAAVSLPIFAWAIILLAVYASQYILRLNLWDTIGVAAYVLGYALLESLIVFAVVMVVLLLIPARFHGPRTIPLTAAILFLTSALVIFLNATQERPMIRGNFTESLIALAVYLVLVVVAVLVIRRSARIAGLMAGLVDRLVPLAVLYSVAGLAGVVIVIIRNVLA